jgi:steroid delta-isomerase-like uncharacterized protein
MSAETSTTLARWLWEELWNRGDMAGAEAYVDTARYVEHDPAPGMPPTWEGVVGLVRLTREAFPDLRSTADDIVAQGDRVACRWTLRGTQRGAYLGIPPTGRTVAIAGMGFARVADGKVVEHWGVVDLLGLMQQLGAVPPMGPPSS